MSRNAKIALIVIGSLAVVCVAVCAAGFFLLPTLARNLVSDNPANAKQVASEIADYTLPPGYAERMGMNFLVYKMVMIAPEQDASSGMFIMLMGTQAAGVDQADMERQMQQSFQQQFGRNGSRMEVVGQERVTIRGKETTITIAESDASPKMRQAIGAFEGKNGLVVVMLMGSANDWDDGLMREFLSSIR